MVDAGGNLPLATLPIEALGKSAVGTITGCSDLTIRRRERATMADKRRHQWMVGADERWWYGGCGQQMTRRGNGGEALMVSEVGQLGDGCGQEVSKTAEKEIDSGR